MPRPLGVTSIQIMAAVRDGDAYGLDLVASTALSSGTVYPTLSRLRKAGLVESRWEDQRIADREGRPRRRYYALTPDGVEALAQGIARYRGLVASLSGGETVS